MKPERWISVDTGNTITCPPLPKAEADQMRTLGYVSEREIVKTEPINWQARAEFFDGECKCWSELYKTTKAELSASQAEVARLRGVIQAILTRGQNWGGLVIRDALSEALSPAEEGGAE